MNKQLIALFGMGTVIVILVFVITASSGNKSSEPQPIVTSSDMSDHHSAQASNDENFLSLLNKEAPNFTLESFDGKQYQLSDLRGKRVVLFFTEGLMCYPSCWNQMVALA